MMSTLRILLHRFSRLLWYSTVVVLVVLAIAISVARTFFPELHAYRDSIEQWASEAVGQTVKIGHFDARLVGLTPTFVFSDVKLLDAAEQEIIRFRQARIGLATLASLRQRAPVPEKVTLVGVNLAITRQADGGFEFHGFDIASMRSDAGSSDTSKTIVEWFFSRSSLAIRDSAIIWQDLGYSEKKHLLKEVNVHIRNAGDRHAIEGYFLPPVQLGTALDFSAVFIGEPENIEQWSGEILVSGQRLDVGAFHPLTPWLGIHPRSGKLDVSLWGDWQAGQLHSLQGQLKADRFGISVEKKDQPFELRRVAANFHLQRVTGGWRVDVSDLQLVERNRSRWPEINLSLKTYNAVDAPVHFEATIDEIPLANLSRFLIESRLVSAQFREKLQVFNLRGELTNVYLRSAFVDPQAHPFQISGRLKKLGFDSVDGIPGVDGISGTIWTDETHGRLDIVADSVGLDFGKLFRTPLHADTVVGQLDWFLYDDEWHLTTNNLLTANDEITAESAVTVSFPKQGGAVYMDSQTHFRDGDAAKKSTYLPTGIMHAGLVEWLDASILSGNVIRGTAIFNGRLGDFPFQDKSGRFLVAYESEAMHVRYDPSWPVIEQGEMNVEFTGQGVAIDVTAGKMAGNDVTDATLRIPSYFDPVLQVQAKSQGSTADALAFLYNSPIAANAREFLTSLDTGGSAAAQLYFQLPLSADAEKNHQTSFHGKVNLVDSVFRAFDGRTEATQIQGQIRFSEQGVWADGLSAMLWQKPIKLDVTSLPVEEHSVVQVKAKGQSELKDVLTAIEFSDAEKQSGTVDWQALLNFGYTLEERVVEPRLMLNAEIREAQLDLPKPLDFSAQSTVPIALSVSWPVAGQPVTRLDLGSRVSAIAEWQLDSATVDWRRAELRFGDIAQLPEDFSLRLVGSPGQIELRRWLSLASAFRSGTEQPVIRRRARPIVMELGSVEVVPSKHKGDKVQLKPDDIPVLRGGIEHFVFNEMQLGRLEVSTSEDRTGYNIDNLSLHSDVFDIVVNGKLGYSHGKNTTALFLKAVSSDVGEMARQLRYAASIEDAQGEIDLTLYWDDELARFSWEKVSGTAQLKMENGVISNIEPGAGRLFGLLSLSALPQRLELDFSDMKKGFHFDRLEGDLRISDGSAFNDDLRIVGRSGVIQLKGRTGLVARDFDQTVTVVPKIGDTVAVGTGFAFGPQVGVVVLLLERLLGQPLNNAASIQYHVTGPWDEPVVERLGDLETELDEDDDV